MKIFGVAIAACAILIAVPGASQAWAQARSNSEEPGDERLRRVLAAVAGQALAAAPFIERRLSALTNHPLESRGTLSFSPAGVIEKLTVSPIRERVTITAESVTIDGGGKPPTVIKLDGQGAMAAYGLGLRALLSGNEKALRQVFDSKFSGSFDQWKVQLLPKDPALRRGIRQIMVSGAGANLRVIETSEPNGDVLELTILTR